MKTSALRHETRGIMNAVGDHGPERITSLVYTFKAVEFTFGKN